MSIRSNIGEWILDLVALLGLGLGGAQAAAAGEIQSVQEQSLFDHPTTLPTPAELAAAVVKGHLSFANAANLAQFAGLNNERFALLVQTTGNPPGPELLLDEWRKGRIDDATFRKGLQEGYLRDDWIDFYINRKYDILSFQEYVQANVQGYVNDAQLLNLGLALGVDANDVQIAQEVAGDPPGPIEVLRMWNRGLLTEEQATQALRESRLKNKYIPALLALHETLVPARTITVMLERGAVDKATADEMLAKLGYTPAVRAAYIASAAKAKTSTTHDLTLATVRSLYADRVIDRQTAVADLGKLGYDTTESAELLDLEDGKLEQRFRNAAISKIGQLFIGSKLTKPEASTRLDGIGVASTQRDHLLTLWELERTASVKHLTVGQLNAAYKHQLITREVFVSRVVAMGYDQADAEILAEIDVPPVDNSTPPVASVPTGP